MKLGTGSVAQSSLELPDPLAGPRKPVTADPPRARFKDRAAARNTPSNVLAVSLVFSQDACALTGGASGAMGVEIVIGNKKRGARGEYVGRPSPLGNPFSHLRNTLAQYRVATREEAVRSYAGWLRERIAARDERVCGELDRLARVAREHGGLTLVCWCAPRSCHAAVIRDVLLDMEEASLA